MIALSETMKQAIKSEEFCFFTSDKTATISATTTTTTTTASVIATATTTSISFGFCLTMLVFKSYSRLEHVSQVPTSGILDFGAHDIKEKHINSASVALCSV